VGGRIKFNDRDERIGLRIPFGAAFQAETVPNAASVLPDHQY